eukprot:CAMPEP_0171143068 /NCGR_PEP_ID=MMETSP0766_2-20121228/143673_1 /TAXON_ID=439317 /ORGANISM="Gambierdiscus australes, Strain CAWD 149" /LENGTH=437 /DNA_ID=CAMNT_0011606885 /DNA_START=81 /DNA_END=1394 /DNA_ORIENTATION=+
MSHLYFAICVSLLCLGALTLLPTLPLQLRGIAVCDGLLCLTLAEIGRHAGPTGEYEVARALLGLHCSLLVTTLPGLAVVASLKHMLWLTRLTGAGYAIAAVHAAAVTLHAVTRLVTDGAAPENYASSRCLRSNWVSPAGWILSLIQRAVEADPYPSGATPQGEPCSVAAAPVATDAEIARCDAIDLWELVFFVLLGAYVVAWLAVCLLCTIGTRIAPVGSTDSLGRSLASRSLQSLSRSWKRLAIIAGLVLVAVLIGVLGSVVLPCQSSTEEQSTSTPNPEEVTTTTGNCTGIQREASPTQGPPMMGCSCGEIGSGGLEPWVAVSVNQFAITWCELGNWAPVPIGLLLYLSHCYACSLAMSQAARCARLTRHISKSAVFRFEPPVSLPMSPAGPRPSRRARESEEVTETALVLFQAAPKDPLPEPCGVLGNQRIFDV